MSAGKDNRCFPSKIPDDLDSSRLSIPVGGLGFRKWFGTGGIFWKEFIRIRVVLVLRKNFGAFFVGKTLSSPAPERKMS